MKTKIILLKRLAVAAGLFVLSIAALLMTQSSAHAAALLAPGQTLSPGEVLTAPNGVARLAMQGDGNLVLYSKSNRVLWFTHTEGNSGARLVMQGDGNLVVYSTTGKALWASGTQGNGGAFVQVQTDGNVVIYSGNASRALWQSNTRAYLDSLEPGQALSPGQEIRSESGQHRLVMQGDGNLVLYNAAGTARWNSSTFSAGSRVVMQGDGNLVIYDTSGRAKWASGTNGYSGSRLVMQDDGNLVIYDPSSRAVWDTHTRVIPDNLPPGQTMKAGDEIRSANGKHRLVMQGDGNLVVYGPNGARWATGTYSGGSWAAMQTDGNLVVYNSSGTAKWASGTNGRNNARLVMQDDGNLVIYDAGGVARWSIGAYSAAGTSAGGYQENFESAGFDAKFTGPYPAGDPVERWRPLALLALQMVGESPSTIDLMMRRLRQESSGNPNAINLWDSNAQRGTPSKGLMQTINSTFNAYSVAPYKNHIYSPLGNMLASLRYAKAAYGSVSAAYLQPGGY